MSDIPEKYRMSEVGVIPEEWEVKQLGEIAKITMGQSPKSVFYNINGDGLPLIQGNADIENRKTIIRTFTSSITKKGKNGDIIMSVRAPVGEIARATFDCCLGRGVCAVSYKNDYLYHYLIHFEKFWAKLSKGSTFDSINSKEVNELEIALPKLDEEQRAIASALNDVDALIAALEQLITKKRNIKQGAMQQLLTGKKRLPGFSGEWEEEKIKNISSITTGARNTQDKIDNAEYPFFVRSSIVERINSFSFNGEAVLTAGDGVGTGKVFHYINGKFDLHQRVYKISDFSEKIDGYFFYLYFSNYFLKRIMTMTAKSSVDSVRMEMIAEMPIPLPPLPEQQYIAQILSDIDNEIEALILKRNKYKALKQGMMQELLTGKTRLL
jgi:type I restriction enzyme S subunit